MSAAVPEVAPAADAREAAPVLDVVIPVFNEERQLADSVERVLAHLGTLPWTSRITIADNASTDGTAVVARRLAHRFDAVRVVELPQKGRGRALREVWSTSPSRVLVYMDVDLSTDLNALLPLVAPLLSGHSDLSIGTRLGRGSRVVRGPRREVISRCYNALLRGALGARFSDAQCGFKAITAEAAGALLPLVSDGAWFFDTELLVLAERSGLRTHEVPVDWVDDPDSRVDVLRTALDDLRGIARLGGALLRRRVPLEDVTAALGRTSLRASTGSTGTQVALFALVGACSTVAYAVLFVLAAAVVSSGLANVLALLVTGVLNTAANRRLTFGLRSTRGRLRDHAQGLVVFAAGVGVTSGSLAVLHGAGGHGRGAEVVVLTAANLLVTIGRFLALRWIFRASPARAVPA